MYFESLSASYISIMIWLNIHITLYIWPPSFTGFKKHVSLVVSKNLQQHVVILLLTSSFILAKLMGLKVQVQVQVFGPGNVMASVSLVVHSCSPNLFVILHLTLRLWNDWND